MTKIVSGQINTGSNTPTNQPMKVAVDNPYITKDDFVDSFEAAGLNITRNSPQYSNGQLDLVILRASAWVNRYCARWFDTQTIDEQRTGFTVRPYNPQLVTCVLNNRPYSRINSVYIQVLQWFIQVVVTGPNSYLQDFYDKGFYKIVPLLSTAGTGVGSPIPAAILDHVPLGILWTNYTFGYGTVLTSQAMPRIGETKQYQSPQGNRLWAPDQPINIYDTGVLVATSEYDLDCPNGMVTFHSGYTVNGAVTSDFTTNESTPFDIKEACILLVAHLIGQALQNPVGAAAMSIQTFSITFGAKSEVKKRVEEILNPYANQLPQFMGL